MSIFLFVLFFSNSLAANQIFGFYNVFITKTNGLYDHALGVVAEQLDQLRASGLLANTAVLYVRVICDNPDCPVLPLAGANVNIVAVRAGGEYDTLVPLWKRALELRNTDALIYYIHSKGTFTVKTENTLLRRGLMQAVVDNWTRCMHVLLQDATTCGMRFSVFPHPHFPGNMWWARADYAASLVIPTTFAAPFEFDGSACQPYSIGRERFGAEHWVASAPHNRPFDCLDRHSRYIHSYDYLNELHSGECLPAPRTGTFESNQFVAWHCFTDLKSACMHAENEVSRLYARQYNETRHTPGFLANFVYRCAKK